MTSTRMIRALSAGLDMKAISICLCSKKTITANSATNTSIRNRKMRGEDSLSGSISIAISSKRSGGPPGLAHTMPQTGDKEKADDEDSNLKLGHCCVRCRLELVNNSPRLRRHRPRWRCPGCDAPAP